MASGAGSGRATFRIEPFKHRVELDPQARPPEACATPRRACPLSARAPRFVVQYAEKTWKVLEDAIREIFSHNASGLSFEELYRCATRVTPDAWAAPRCAFARLLARCVAPLGHAAHARAARASPGAAHARALARAALAPCARSANWRVP